MCCKSFVLKVEGWKLILFKCEDGCMCMPTFDILRTLRIVK